MKYVSCLYIRYTFYDVVNAIIDSAKSGFVTFFAHCSSINERESSHEERSFHSIAVDKYPSSCTLKCNLNYFFTLDIAAISTKLLKFVLCVYIVRVFNEPTLIRFLSSNNKFLRDYDRFSNNK